MGTPVIERSGLVAPESVFTLKVSAEDSGIRVDSYISKQFALYSRSFFQRLIESSRVTHNDRLLDKAGIKVQTDDIIVVQFPPAREVNPTHVAHVDFGVSIVYEHEHFIVVNKPAGLMVHAAKPETSELTLVDWILHHYQEISKVGYADRPGIIHRLDKDTSGLMIIPRTTYAHIQFGKMFRDRTIHKTYLAVVYGHPNRTGSVNLPIGRDPVSRVKMKAFDRLSEAHSDERVRQSLTHYTVKEYFENTSLVEAKPVTGRTHQIRVHMAAAGHGLLGDVLYSRKSSLIERQALHAAGIAFIFDGILYEFEQELPADMNNLVTQLRASYVQLS